MEPALKQRLLGAAVLVALAVIFLPMFFSGPPPKTDAQQSLSLDIPPAPDVKMESRVYALPPAGSGSVASHTASPAPEPMTEPTPASPSSAATVALAASANTASAVPTPAPAKPEVSVPVAPPKPKPAAPAATAAAADTTVAYLVSLGVYADRGNAEARLAEVRKLGYKAHLEQVPINGKPTTGVRVGPFAGRASAETARLKLQDAIHGAKPALVAVAQSAASSASDAKAPTRKAASAGWAVQLAALRSRADALAMKNRVHAAGFDAFVDDTRGADGTWWRVRVGPRAERAGADKLAAQIKAKLHMTAIVVPHP